MKLWILSVFLLLGSTMSGPAATDPSSTTPYELTITDDRVSLRVTDGSVVMLVEDLGRRLDFEVIAHGVSDARVTLDFEGIPIREALRTICKPVGYVEVTDPSTGKTARLVLTPNETGATKRGAARRDPLPARRKPPPEPIEPADEQPADEGQPVDEDPPEDEDPPFS
jgi:hypothetical protein